MLRISLKAFTLICFLSVGCYAQSVLNFPRLDLSPERITGIAIFNPNPDPAQVTLTAFGEEGSQLELVGLENPVTVTVPAGRQFAQITASLFGSPADDSTVAWFQATSDAPDLTGFFLYLDNDVTLFDGADLPLADTRLVFGNVHSDAAHSTELSLVNPSQRATIVELDLLTASGSFRSEIRLPALGTARLDLAQTFGLTSEVIGGQVVAQAFKPIAGVQFVEAPGDFWALNAVPTSRLLNRTFFPQLAVLPPFVTEVFVTNQGNSDTLVTVHARRPDGTLYGPEHVRENPVTRLVPAGASIAEDLEQLFGFEGNETLSGWVEVGSQSQSINALLTYAIPGANSRAAVASVSEGTRNAVFSHLATTLGFFTGVAVLNAGSVVANVEIAAISATNQILGTFQTSLAPGQRISELVVDIIPGSANQAGGFVWVRSDVPVYLTSLFGNIGSGVLANIPPQSVPAAYEPEGIPAPATVSPFFVVLQPGQQQVFQLNGASSAPTWSVDGVPGGGGSAGTIGSAGSYQAPTIVPSRLPVFVGASTGSLGSGASVDIIARETLQTGLGLVQSVAYLAGASRLFTAELSGVASAEDPRPLGGTGTTVFDVTGGQRQVVATFPGDGVTKMIPFVGVDLREYLLAGGGTTGRLYRIDPGENRSMTVRTLSDPPLSIALDPGSGGLVATTQSGNVVSVGLNVLNQGLTPAASAGRDEQDLQVGLGFSGVALDPCNGDIYISDPLENQVLRLDRFSGSPSVLALDIADPGQILALERNGVSCPEKVHLLVLERGRSRIRLIVPSTGQVLPWAAAPGATDLAMVTLAGEENGLERGAVSERQGVAVTTILSGIGRIEFFPTLNLYSQMPQNVPPIPLCLAAPFFEDPNLGLLIRSSLQLPIQFPLSCAVADTVLALDLRGSGLTSLGGIEFFPNLIQLLVDRNQIADLGPLRALGDLESLSASSNQIGSVAPLEDLLRLDFVELAFNQISDIGPLERLRGLEVLSVSGNQVQDLSPLARMTQLTGLGVFSNEISNISPLERLVLLDTLFLDLNMISDIQVLSGLERLADLRMTVNQISNLAPLVQNEGIAEGDMILVQANPLGPDQCQNIAMLRARGAEVQTDLVCPASLVTPEADSDDSVVGEINRQTKAGKRDNKGVPPQ